MNTQQTYLEQIQYELKQTPSEYLPTLLNIIHLFRESVCINSPEDSFLSRLARDTARRIPSY